MMGEIAERRLNITQVSFISISCVRHVTIEQPWKSTRIVVLVRVVGY